MATAWPPSAEFVTLLEALRPLLGQFIEAERDCNCHNCRRNVEGRAEEMRCMGYAIYVAVAARMRKG